jgi:hypothetical protein
VLTTKILKAVSNNNNQGPEIMPLLSLNLFSAMLQLLLIWPRPSTLLTDFHFIVSLFYQATVSQILLNYYLDKEKITSDDDKAFAATVKGLVTSLSKNVQVASKIVVPATQLERIQEIEKRFTD